MHQQMGSARQGGVTQMAVEALSVRSHLQFLTHLLDLAALLLGEKDLPHHTLLQRGEVGLDVLEVVADVLADQEVRRATLTAVAEKQHRQSARCEGFKVDEESLAVSDGDYCHQSVSMS